MMRILIIEDEPLAADHLERLLIDHLEDLNITAKLSSVKKTITWWKNNSPPDLIFMDVQLADGLCFEIFEKIEIDTPIIFTTAYDQYALKAFKVNSVDYLLKPIHPDDLNKALDKYHSIFKSDNAMSPGISTETLHSLLQNIYNKYKERFVIKVGVHLKPIEITNIRLFTSQHKITYLVTTEGRKYPVDHTLQELEKLVDPSLFFRINRQDIIARSAIADVIAYGKSRLKIKVTSLKEDMVVSRERIASFKHWLGQ